MEAKSLDATAAMCWIDIVSLKEEQLDQVEESLRSLLDNKSGGNSKHIDSLMALAKLLEVTKKFKDSLNILNDTIALYKGFLPPLIERAKVIFLFYSCSFLSI